MKFGIRTSCLVALLAFNALSANAALPMPMPMSPSVAYSPIASCNQGKIAFFGSISPEGTPANPQGVMAVYDASQAIPMSLTAIDGIKASENQGVEFQTSVWGSIVLDSQGNGELVRQEAYQDASGVIRPRTIKTQLKCRYVGPVPTGFSVGN